jgi:hypothetical protein
MLVSTSWDEEEESVRPTAMPQYTFSLQVSYIYRTQSFCPINTRQWEGSWCALVRPTAMPQYTFSLQVGMYTAPSHYPHLYPAVGGELVRPTAMPQYTFSLQVSYIRTSYIYRTQSFGVHLYPAVGRPLAARCGVISFLAPPPRSSPAATTTGSTTRTSSSESTATARPPYLIHSRGESSVELPG